MHHKFLQRRLVIFILLAGIVLLAAVIRFNQLGEVPNSLYWDEAADGYNAYSILQTGKDEYGTRYPLLFRSFDDYKMPGMVYLMSVGIGMFGVTEFAIRFFNVIFGLLMIVATYYFVRALFGFENIDILFKIKQNKTVITAVSLLSSFLLAISPWHIQFTRTGYEASMAATLILAGMLFFLKSFSNPRLLLVSSFFIALSLYFYRSMFLFLGVFIPVMALIFFSDLLHKIPRKILFVSLALFVIVALPITIQVFTPPGNSRGNEVSIFNNVGQKISQNQLWAIQSGNGYLGNIFFNKRFVYSSEILTNYFSHFTAQFLFLTGDANERHSTRNMGMMYLWELPFLLLGIYILVLRGSRKVKLVVFAWLLIAPIPAAISIFAPHALRTFNMLPMPQLLTALGLVYGFYRLRVIFRPIYVGIITCIMLFALSSYLFNYYHLSNRLSAQAWADGYKQANEYVTKHDDAYDQVIISGHYWQPYVYTLFYTQYSPEAFQTSGSSRAFGKYLFGGTSWEKNGPPELDKEDLYVLSNGKKTMVVLSPGEYEYHKLHLKHLATVKSIDESTRFIIGELLPPNHENIF